MAYRFRKTDRCAFCTKKADSHEHAWPNWTLQRFGRPGTGIIGDFSGLKYVDPQQRALTFRCVCEKDCNNGWMKRLEEEVIPTAGNMMHDLSITLDIPQQLALARWAIKTAMVFEYVSDTRSLFYTDEERFGLRGDTTGFALPANTAVWLARYHGVGSFLTIAHDLSTHASDRGSGQRSELPTYLTTMLFAKLIVQVITIHYDNQGTRLPVPVSPNLRRWRNSYNRIWPTERIVLWPPNRSVVQDGVTNFHQRFDD